MALKSATKATGQPPTFIAKVSNIKTTAYRLRIFVPGMNFFFSWDRVAGLLNGLIIQEYRFLVFLLFSSEKNTEKRSKIICEILFFKPFFG